MKRRRRYGEAAVAEENKKKRLSNQEIVLVTYIFLILFLIMIAFLVYFMYKKAPSYVNNPYNANRQAILEERYIRGDILSADRQVLATTIEEDGTERRYYPYGEVFAHIVGYNGRGTSGIEQMENASLLSSHDNPVDVLTNELFERKNKGDMVVTTLLTEIQEAAFDALGDMRGAVVAIEPSTGKIVAMVSKPCFDPNNISEIWDDITSEDRKNDAVLVNRGSQGLYPPGSTFKIVTLLELLREKPKLATEFSYDCEGVYTEGQYSIKCAHNAEHGVQNLTEAFANSCNGAFVDIGRQLSFRSVYRLCDDLGFNTALPTDFPSSKSKFTLKEDNDVGTVMQTSIGQGETLVTPLHMALIMSAIANKGRVMEPYVVDHVVSSQGYRVSSNTPKQWRRMMSEEEADHLSAYLRAVVTEGTGTAAEGDGYNVYGKTGTAEYNSSGGTHAWFVGYSSKPGDDRRLVVAVLVENGQSGGDVAAPICREVMDAYYGG
ncbi:MAG: penicillin-binding protein 2 [Lachnospiraceae bacterium]|nr:penicillin-binding protein 2 [Lachnospiraceae bacterium]